MQIQLEPRDNHSVQSYDQNQVVIMGHTYHENLLLTSDKIISPWDECALTDLTLENFNQVLDDAPEIILIGHCYSQTTRPYALIQALSAKRIGIECGDIGSACRTFNVLLNENRRVVLAVLFNHKSNN